MRITTNMVMRNYQNNLTSSLSALESRRQQVQSGRRFAHSYEDPTAAASGSTLERKYCRVQNYLDNAENTQKWQDTQEDVVNQLSSMVKTVVGEYSPKAMNDPSGSGGRSALAASLRELQKSMVYSLNTKYGDAYAMAGADGSNAPFELSADGKTLTYRGLDVNDPANKAALDELTKENAYVDLGFGLSFDAADKIVSSSAFDSALPGISVVGYGQDDAGTSKNLVVLMGQMADELEKPAFNSDAYAKLWDGFKDSSVSVQNAYTKLGTKTQLLKSTISGLENQKLAITEQYDSVINVDSAEAITNYSWAMYAYNTALKVGTSILSPSLLDFMK